MSDRAIYISDAMESASGKQYVTCSTRNGSGEIHFGVGSEHGRSGGIRIAPEDARAIAQRLIEQADRAETK